MDTKIKILDRRRAIRHHRDQRGDDRCWLDDFLVWKFLPDGPHDPTTLAEVGDGMEKCRAFFVHRRSETVDPIPEDAIVDSAHWDDDLQTMSHDELATELQGIDVAIKKHWDIHGRPRTIDDDQALYRILPEKMPADFRLPKEEIFLGTAKEGVGCPCYWKSHELCGDKHNFHKWGPCKK